MRVRTPLGARVLPGGRGTRGGRVVGGVGGRGAGGGVLGGSLRGEDWQEVAYRTRLIQRSTKSSFMKQGYLSRDMLLNLYNQNVSASDRPDCVVQEYMTDAREACVSSCHFAGCGAPASSCFPMLWPSLVSPAPPAPHAHSPLPPRNYCTPPDSTRACLHVVASSILRVCMRLREGCGNGGRPCGRADRPEGESQCVRCAPPAYRVFMGSKCRQHEALSVGVRALVLQGRCNKCACACVPPQGWGLTLSHRSQMSVPWCCRGSGRPC